MGNKFGKNLVGTANVDVNWKKNFYNVDKKGNIVEHNKSTHRKKVVGKIGEKKDPNYVYYVDGDGIASKSPKKYKPKRTRSKSKKHH